MDKFSKKIIAASVVAMMSASGMALAVGTGGDFTVSEGAIPGTPVNNIVVDSFDFSYTARIEQTNDGGLLNGDYFKEVGYLDASSYKLGVVSPASYLGSPEPDGYDMYALFTLEGNATVSNGGITASFTSGTITLYIDGSSNTTLALPVDDGVIDGVVGPVTRVNIGDDQEIGSASIVSAGEAHLFAGLANGDYEVVWGDWDLTAFGSSYWTDPLSFYTVIHFNGNTTTVTPPGSTTVAFNSVADGSGNAFFNVPEPGTIALLGLGLLGLGFSQKRKQNI